MKCSFNSNINKLFVLVIMICFARSIIVENNLKNNNKNILLAKQQGLTIKKIGGVEIKVSKLEKNIKRLNFTGLKSIVNKETENGFFLNFKNILPMLISFTALGIGFIFAGIFTIIAFLYSEYIIFF